MALLSEAFQFIWSQLYGRHVIAPTINAARTWEGLVGGSASTALAGMVLHWATPYKFLWQTAFMSMIVAVMGFAGAMTMSAIKRDPGRARLRHARGRPRRRARPDRRDLLRPRIGSQSPAACPCSNPDKPGTRASILTRNDVITQGASRPWALELNAFGVRRDLPSQSCAAARGIVHARRGTYRRIGRARGFHCLISLALGTLGGRGVDRLARRRDRYRRAGVRLGGGDGGGGREVIRALSADNRPRTRVFAPFALRELTADRRSCWRHVRPALLHPVVPGGLHREQVGEAVMLVHGSRPVLVLHAVADEFEKFLASPAFDQPFG